jgi:hypothetical protein
VPGASMLCFCQAFCWFAKFFLCHSSVLFSGALVAVVCARLGWFEAKVVLRWWRCDIFGGWGWNSQLRV